RVHLSAIGHPVVGNPLYGGVRRRVPGDIRAVTHLDRPFLHAARLAFTHPIDGRRLEFTSDLPEDLQRVLDELRHDSSVAKASRYGRRGMSAWLRAPVGSARLWPSDCEVSMSSVNTVYKGRVFDVEVGTVRMSNGRAFEVAIVRHPPSVVLIPIREDGRVILVRQYRPSVRRELWELPAGTLKAGESPEQGAARECEEETGLR